MNIYISIQIAIALKQCELSALREIAYAISVSKT